MKFTARIILIGLFALPITSLWAAPAGFSVNSDEPGGDRLFRINLANGVETERGLVRALASTRLDVEGLAFDNKGVLWGVDDQALKLFPIVKANGTVVLEKEVSISGLGSVASNDFGLTFTCEGDLFVTSVADNALYRLKLDGTATKIGTLGANISAIAAFGKPTELYGLGNGLKDEGASKDNRSLFSINTSNGAASKIGIMGSAASDYFQAGLSFDNDGILWAITDRNAPDSSLGSELLQINLKNGKATKISTTTVTGFESLAVAPPMGCEADAEPPFIPRDPNPTGYHGIPALGDSGRLLAVLVLLLGGLAALRYRP